ncbi:MAG: tol-pal system-associated acyl-CoA thioesterase [Methylocystis sp.]|nr:tol-pal system-associated acyl-CoA thioesterase [Methylocystis sp.]
MTSPHLHPVRVYYEDTDFSGFVYHASYLRFMERGRTELLRELGVHQRALLEDEADALFFVVRAMTIDFKKPARMDDLLTVETLVDEAAGATVALTQRIRRGEEILASASVTVVAVQDGRPRRLPPKVREKFASAARRLD